MTEILEYIYSSIWTFLGTVILITIIIDGIVEIIMAIKGHKHTKDKKQQHEEN